VSNSEDSTENTNTAPAGASKLHKLPAVAKAADLDRKTLVAAIQRGELPAVRIGTRYYLTSETIAAFFKPRTQEVPAT
jgi:hypothetical protein